MIIIIINNAFFGMVRMTRGTVQELMCISRFRVEICQKVVTFSDDLSVMKTDALLRPL